MKGAAEASAPLVGPDRVRITWRLAAACSLAVVITLGILTSALYRHQVRQLRSQFHMHGEQLTRYFASDAAPALLTGDTARLESLAGRLLEHGEIVFVGVRAPSGSRVVYRAQGVSAPNPAEPGTLVTVHDPGSHDPYLLVSQRVEHPPQAARLEEQMPAQSPPPGDPLGILELGLSLEPLRSTIATLRLVTLCDAAAAAVPGVLLIALMLLRIVRPLRDLHRATQRVADGDLSRALPVPRTPELAPLARSFNTMLTQVRSVRAKMEETNRNLEAIVNERTRALQRSERKYRSFLEQAGVGILVWDPETLRIVEANAKAGELFGDVPANLLNGSVDELFAARDRARRRDELSEINEQGTVLLNDGDLEQRDGGSFPAEVEASLVRFGNETLVLGMFRNLTETRALERREVLLNEKISRSERMASIGQLAAGVAHEINNPMSYMASNVNRLVDFSKLLAEISEQSLAPGAALDRLAEINEIVAELQEIAADTCEGVARVTEIVTALREFSHGGRADAGYEWVDVNRVIRNCLTLVRNEIKDRATVHLELQPLPRVLCNATQIGQVLMNLLSNAAQAMDNRGVILVTSCSGGDRVHLAVEDNGRGIPPDALPKIFDPFFTTKAVGHGTGLGLSVSHEIIRKHGGALWVDSRVGHGTRFLIELVRDGPPEAGMSDEDSPAASEDEPEPC